ncbi:hypothetical protein ACQUW5_00920 [Legionella sp. CNM-1927-20]|uniref:hypothetical protein n=1 Tax=Legionella sp. CNM-1927-20 TaxID=3422221 RepID=UPI00403B23A4
MTTKKPINLNEYELTEFDIPVLRTEPVQIENKKFKLPQAEIKAILDCVSDVEQDFSTKEPVNSKKH